MHLLSFSSHFDGRIFRSKIIFFDFDVFFQLLERCANPSGSREGIRLAAPEEIRIELYKALREVMDIARQVDHSEEDLKQLDRDI